MSQKRGCVVDWWTGIGVVAFRTWDERVCGTESVRTVRAVCTVNADLAFSLANGPLNGVDDEAEDEVEKEARKMNMI
jgi:hypothetical protein